MELPNLSEEKIDHTHARDELLRRDRLLLHEQLSEQHRDFREAHEQSVSEMEELKRRGLDWTRVGHPSSRGHVVAAVGTLRLFLRSLRNKTLCALAPHIVVLGRMILNFSQFSSSRVAMLSTARPTPCASRGVF